MAEPKVDSWFKLKADLGGGHGMVPKGSMCQVTHIFPAATVGVGTTDEAVVVRFLEESTVTGRVCERRFTLNLADFNKTFVVGAEPPELKRWTDAQNAKAGGRS